MNAADWMTRLASLGERANGLGTTVDLTSPSIVELWGVHGFLTRIGGAPGE